jgi:hypothetical protein
MNGSEGSRMSEPTRITLAQAVERYRQEPGSYSNAYDWYRKQAHQSGTVSLGGREVTAFKVGRQWMVHEAEVDSAIAAHRDQMAKRHQATVGYEAHILYGGDGASIRTDWGGYRVSDTFHFAWSDYAIATSKSDVSIHGCGSVMSCGDGYR